MLIITGHINYICVIADIEVHNLSDSYENRTHYLKPICNNCIEITSATNADQFIPIIISIVHCQCTVSAVNYLYR